MNGNPPELNRSKTTTLRLPDDLTGESGPRLLDDTSRMVSEGTGELRIDFSGVRRSDSFGMAWLIRAVRKARAAGVPVSFEGATGDVAELVRMIHGCFEPPPVSPAPREGALEAIGEKTLGVWGECVDMARVVVDALYWSFIAPVEGRGLRWKGLLIELREMGWRAIGIVSLINFLLGVVIAMLSAAQLRTFGIQILVASAVVIGFARELAVVMTGVVVSARTGAAIAAELATMTVSEEIDALKGMGISVGKFLIAPKVLAIIVSMPILTVIGFVTGVAGGFVVGIFFLGFAFERWWNQTINAITAGDLVQGLVKSFVFALIIVIVGCHNGLRVTGGARGVGLVTTRAVVLDIFFIVVADMLFALVFFYLT